MNIKIDGAGLPTRSSKFSVFENSLSKHAPVAPPPVAVKAQAALQRMTASTQLSLNSPSNPTQTETATTAEPMPRLELPDYMNDSNKADQQFYAHVLQKALDAIPKGSIQELQERFKKEKLLQIEKEQILNDLEEEFGAHPYSNAQGEDLKKEIEKLKVETSKLKTEMDKLQEQRRSEIDRYIETARIELEVQRRFGINDLRETLWQAIASSNVEKVREILFSYTTEDLNRGDIIDPSTFLSALALGGNVEIARQLADKGFNFNVHAADGSNLLHLAAKNGNTELMGFLLKAMGKGDMTFKVNDLNFFGDTALNLAIKNNQSDAVATLIKFPYTKGMEPIDLNKGGVSSVLLSIAVSQAPKLAIQLKSETSLDILYSDWSAETMNTPRRDSETILKEGIINSKTGRDDDFMRMIFGDNEELSTKFFAYTDGLGQNDELVITSILDSNESTNTLLKAKALDASRTDQDNRNAFHYLAINHAEGVQSLASDITKTNPSLSKFDLNAWDKYGWTPLAYAATDQFFNEGIIKYFLAAGADPLKTTRSGQTIIDLAVSARLASADMNHYAHREIFNEGTYALLDTNVINFNSTVTDVTGDRISLVEAAVRYGALEDFDYLDKKGAVISADQHKRMEALRKQRADDSD